MTPADSWPVHLLHILAYFLPNTVEYIEPESGVEWADRMTNQTLGHYIPVTRNHDTNNNDGSFRSYFLQIPGTFEHFQARSLSFEMFHFRILRCDGRGERVQWLLIVPTVTSLQLTAGESREATEKHGGLVGGWLEDGWRTAWSGQLDYHRQQSNSPSKLYSIDCCDIWGTITARQSWHFLSFNLVSAGRDTGQDLSDCDNKKQINIRPNVASLNVTAGGEILSSQSVFQ